MVILQNDSRQPHTGPLQARILFLKYLLPSFSQDVLVLLTPSLVRMPVLTANYNRVLSPSASRPPLVFLLAFMLHGILLFVVLVVR